MSRPPERQIRVLPGSSARAKKLLVVLAAFAAGFGTVWWQRLSTRPAIVDTKSEYLAGAERRTLDVSTDLADSIEFRHPEDLEDGIVLALADVVDDADVEAIIAEGFDVRGKALSATEWIPTRIALDSFFLGETKRQACSREALAVDAMCPWVIADLVRRITPETAAIVAVAARAATPAERAGSTQPPPPRVCAVHTLPGRVSAG